MSVISILGNTSPRIGTATKYVAITPYANILRNSMATSQENILWDIYILENGKWRKTQGNSKKGKEVEYNFTQRSLLRKGIKLVANINGETGELLIKPMPALAPKILKVELLDANYRKISKILNYTDVITARAHCVDLDGQIIDFSLWEDDVIGSGHHKDNESNHIATASAKVIKGRADVTFNMSYYTFASYIANMQKPKGQKSEGDTHEYYVTAEYNHKKTASNNINIKNTQNEQPQSNTPKSSTKKSSKYNVLDKKGIVYSIELQDKKGNKINRNIRYGETIKVVIRGHNLVNKPCVLKLWEHDTFGDNDLLYHQNIIMKESPHEVSITLTPKMQKIGEIGNKPKNPDIGEYYTGNYQEIFAEVVYGNTFHKTDTIQVSINAQPTKQETPKSASKVGGNNKDEKKETRKEGMENNKKTNADIEFHIKSSGQIQFKILNDKRENASYFYYDDDDNVHYLGNYKLKKVKDNYGGLYKDKLGKDSDNVYLVDFRNIKKSYSSETVGYSVVINTTRYYMNDVTLAALLGAMLECSYYDFTFNGFSNEKGESVGGSKSHKNGMNGDLRYLRLDKKGGITNLFSNDETVGWRGLDEHRQNKFNNALYKFGWKSMLSQSYGKNKEKVLNHCTNDKNNNHNDHLHIQGFAPNLKEIK